jgi:hypothetical protein
MSCSPPILPSPLSEAPPAPHPHPHPTLLESAPGTSHLLAGPWFGTAALDLFWVGWGGTWGWEEKVVGAGEGSLPKAPCRQTLPYLSSFPGMTSNCSSSPVPSDQLRR